jgi:hypothetical protein
MYEQLGNRSQYSILSFNDSGGGYREGLKNLTQRYLDSQKPSYIKNGYPVPKWIIFSEKMLELGFIVSLHKAKSTYSKYIYLNKGLKKYKVRFSNHRANRGAELSNDCDFYVGVGNRGVITTEYLIEHIKKLEGLS